MKRWLLLFSFTLLASTAQAADIYFAQASAGANNGSSCINARALSTHAIGDDVAGNILHLCGTITAGLNGVGLTILANGSAGNPITVKFETGAILQSPAFLKAIDISNRSYIVVDGGTNGIIQNTANGNSLANQQSPTYGVYARGCTPGCRSTNVNFLTFYVRTAGQAAGSLLQTDVSPVFYLQAPGMRVDHNVMSNCGWCINGYGSSGVEIDHNTVSKMDHGVAMGPDGSGASGALIHDNSFGSMAEWDTPTNPCAFHHDGIHIFSDSGPNTNPQIYNNTFNGDMTDSGNCATAYIFMEGASGGAGITGAKIYNNTVVNGNTTVHGRDMIWMEGRGASANNSVFNNYLVEGNGSIVGLGLFVRNETNFSAKNNVISNSSYQGTTLAAGGVANNVYIDSGNNINFGWNGGQSQSVAGWQAACSCDTGAVMGSAGTVNINTSTYAPSVPSIAIGAGANLTSLGITALNSDKNGVARPVSAAWDAGAIQSGATPPPPPPPGPPPIIVQLPLNVVPLPAQANPPVLSKLAPANTYISAKGYSQDGKTFSPTLTVTATGANLCASCFLLDGVPIPANCAQNTSCTVTLPVMSVAQHMLGVTVPAVAVPILQ